MIYETKCYTLCHQKCFMSYRKNVLEVFVRQTEEQHAHLVRGDTNTLRKKILIRKKKRTFFSQHSSIGFECFRARNSNIQVIAVAQDETALKNIKSIAKSKLLCLTHIFHDVIHERGFEKEIKYSLPVSLSPREKECLGWAAAGKTSVETAIIIDRSMETVRLHIKNAMLKLGVHNRVHAVAKAVQMGLIEPCDTHKNSYVSI